MQIYRDYYFLKFTSFLGMQLHVCAVRDMHLIRMLFVWPMFGFRLLIFHVQNLTAHSININKDTRYTVMSV